MLLTSEMSEIHILTHERYRNTLVEKIHEAGLMEISQNAIPGLEEGEMHPDVGLCASYELRLTKIVNVLKKYVKKKKRIKSLLSYVPPEKKKVKKQALDKKINEAERILQKVEKYVIEGEDEIDEIAKQCDLIDEKIEKIEILSNFNIDLSWIGTSPYLSIKTGISNDIDALRSSLHDVERDNNSTVIKKIWTALLSKFARGHSRDPESPLIALPPMQR